jgi:hypothetical protein
MVAGKSAAEDSDALAALSRVLDRKVSLATA